MQVITYSIHPTLRKDVFCEVPHTSLRVRWDFRSSFNYPVGLAQKPDDALIFLWDDPVVEVRGFRPLRDNTDGGSDIMSDSATFETTRREVRPVLVKLRGEFDVLSQKILAGTLSDCLASGRVTLVDLSSATPEGRR